MGETDGQHQGCGGKAGETILPPAHLPREQRQTAQDRTGPPPTNTAYTPIASSAASAPQPRPSRRPSTTENKPATRVMLKAQI